MEDEKPSGEWAALIEQVEKRVSEDFGERCEYFSPFCGCCMAWRAFDDLHDIVCITGEPAAEAAKKEGRTCD